MFLKYKLLLKKVFAFLIGVHSDSCAKKSSNKGEQLVSSKLSASDVTSDAPIISAPIVGTITGNEIVSDKGVASKLQSDEGVLLDVKEDGSTTLAVICSTSPEDPERIRLEQAATKAQAAFRGYAVCTYFSLSFYFS